MRKYIIGLGLLCLGLLGLCACENSPKPDVKMYDFVYASGYSLDPYARDEVQPVVGAALQLAVSLAEDGAESLQLLDEQGGLLYNLTDFQPAAAQKGGLTLTVRGETAARGAIVAAGGIFPPYAEETGEGALWLCSEVWAKSAYNGYIDGTLRGGRVLLVDASSGRTVFSAETEPGELFLTASGSRCYFYYPGKSSRRKEDQSPAQIYWRDINFWPLTHRVCSFDYVGAPVYDGQEIERLRFYPQADPEGRFMRLDFTCYEQTNAENNRWDYVVKGSVEVPLTNAQEPDEEPADETAAE